MISRYTWCFVVLFYSFFQIGFGQYNFTALDKVLNANKRLLGGNVCMLILKDNKLVYEYTCGDFDMNTIQPIASCSKWLTTALVMTFVDEGKLSLNDYVSKYIPEFNRDGKHFIRIKHCLSHTTGIESEPLNLRGIIAQRKYKTLGDEVNSFSTKAMEGEPGKVFSYSTVGLNIVGRILELISGKDFEKLFQERIARPLSMASTSFYNGKAVNPSGGAVSTASDYIKFLSMILNKGEYSGKRILSTASVEMMQVSQTTGIKKLYVPEGAEGFDYALGEWVQEKDNKGNSLVVSSPGLFGTYPTIDKPRNYAAIVFVKKLNVLKKREIYNSIWFTINQTLTKEKR